MVIGVCRVLLSIPENHSLKGKRHVVKSLIERIKGKFNVSVAEVGDQGLWQMAAIGFACVSNDPRHANEVLSKIVEFIDNSRSEGEIADYQIEILHSLGE